jgi:MFS family permease
VTGASGTYARAREALRGRDFRLLLEARLVSQLGDGLFQAVLVASVVFSPEKQSTTVGFAKAIAILAVPYSLLGPFAGVFIDRWNRRLILVLTPVLRGSAALLVLFGAHRAMPFYAGALVALSANRFFLTTAGAVTPRLVPAADLLVANALGSVGGTVATLVGVVAGGQLADASGFRPVIAITIGTWLAASAIAAGIRTHLSPVQAGPRTGVRQDLARIAGELRQGARRLLHTPRALAPIASIGVGQFVQGLVLVMSLVVFRDRFKEGVGSFAWLVAAGSLGVALGLLTVAPLEGRLGRTRMFALAFATSGLPLVAAAFAIGRIPILLASFALGLGFPWMKVPADTMAQESIPDAYRGRVFAIYDVSNNLARVLAAALAILLLRTLTLTTVVAAAGMALALWVPLIRWWLGRASSLTVRMYAGGRGDEVPRSVELGGVEEPVHVERSWREERAGVRLNCFRLRLEDGSRIEVSKEEDHDLWRLDRELPA